MELNTKQKEEIEESILELRSIPNITGVYVADINGRLISWNFINYPLEIKDTGAVAALLSSMLKTANDVEQILNPNNDTESTRIIVSLFDEETMAIQAGQEAILIIQFGRAGAGHFDSIKITAEKISKSISRTFLSRSEVKPASESVK